MESHINKAIDNNFENKKIKNEEARQKRKEKMKKKKKNLKLDKQIMPISNPDKIGAETWNKKRAKDIGNFPSPSRILLIGSCGTGKSTLIFNLICHQDKPFDEVFLIHEDAEFTTEYDSLDVTQKLSEVPELEFWETDNKYLKRAVICDDIELTSANKERIKNLAIMFRYASTHKNLTIYFAHQSFFSILPLIKKMSNVFIIYKPRARNELAMIENRVGMPKDSLKELFKTIAPNNKDSICIDLTDNSPCKLRLNIWTPIDYNSGDEEPDEEPDEEQEEEVA